MSTRLQGPPDNPERQCFGPNHRGGLLKRFPRKSLHWRHVGPSFGVQGCDYFCSMQCALDWATLKCSAGGSDADDERHLPAAKNQEPK